MLRKLLFTILFVMSLFVVACSSGGGSTTTTDVDQLPAWVSKLPEDPNFVFGVGEGKSRELQIAMDNSANAARAEVGRTLEAKLSDLNKRFAEQTGAAENAQILQMTTTATKTVVSTVLSGCKITERKVINTGGTYQVISLAQYPIGPAKEALANQIKAKEDLYTRFRESQAFQELENDVKKFDESKNK